MARKKEYKVGMIVQLPKNFNLRQYRGLYATIVEVHNDIIRLMFANGTKIVCTPDDLSQKRILSLKERYAIFERDGFRCRICGRNASHGIQLQVDHKTSYHHGGETFADNLWTLCNECNAGKSAKSIKPE